MWPLALALTLLITGCAAPQPAVLPVPVACRVPATFMQAEPKPLAPSGDYTQRDVADYINELYYYAVTGWDRLSAVNAWVNDNCE